MRDGWQRVRLGDLLSQIHRPVDVSSLVEVPFAGVRWYAEGVYARPVEPAVNVKTKTLNRLAVGDVTYNRMWATKASFGIAGPDVDGCLVTNDFPMFAVNLDRVMADFIGLVFHTRPFQEAAAASATGTTERKRLKERDFLLLEIDMPPLAEQRRIGDLIAAVDEAIEEAGTIRDSLRRMAAARRHAVMTPAGPTVPASEAFSILMGRQRSPGRASGPNMVPYLRSANVLDGRLDLSDVKEMDFTPAEQARFALENGDVLVSEGSASAAAVGAASKWTGELPGTVCFQNTLLRYRAIKGVTTPSYVMHWCKWAYESGAFREAASGTNIKHIGSSRAAIMPVPLLNVAEQMLAVDSLDAADECVASANGAVNTLQSLRSELLTALLSGAHEIPESYDEMMGLEPVEAIA